MRDLRYLNLSELKILKFSVWFWFSDSNALWYSGDSNALEYIGGTMLIKMMMMMMSTIKCA